MMNPARGKVATASIDTGISNIGSFIVRKSYSVRWLDIPCKPKHYEYECPEL